MNERKMSPCEGLIEYLTGEGSDMERKRFEKHLASCSSCQEEAILWQQVWDRLGDDVELLELPIELKDEVMGSIFDQKESTSSKSAASTRITRSRFRYTKWATGIAVLLVVFLSG